MYGVWNLWWYFVGHIFRWNMIVPYLNARLQTWADDQTYERDSSCAEVSVLIFPSILGGLASRWTVHKSIFIFFKQALSGRSCLSVSIIQIALHWPFLIIVEGPTIILCWHLMYVFLLFSFWRRLVTRSTVTRLIRALRRNRLSMRGRWPTQRSSPPSRKRRGMSSVEKTPGTQPSSTYLILNYTSRLPSVVYTIHVLWDTSMCWGTLRHMEVCFVPPSSRALRYPSIAATSCDKM